ncbi:CehA/McbA family metallohydrolase [Humisphaera borealis]|uniref:CehA/McbA family metallohydrolase n=1 Tax=Humisphaera borealis TaxID=2807512 RepID=A0A7M2WYK8_9BACT|nr:CehA/McbA family metallohydrolase [Humisphaera borealis]QOV90444.1 CehA/McbA family metallohydrolase [Humisphaera borealis]
MTLKTGLMAIGVCAALTGMAHAGQIVTLDKNNWGLVPGGKEVDAIYGDFLMKNDKVVAVIGSSLPERQLNLRITGAQGSVIDFALLGSNNDQLTVYHPHAFAGEGPAANRVEVIKSDGTQVTLRATRKASAKDPIETVTDYTLKDGDQHLTVVTRRTNTSDKSVKVRLTERLFHEKPAEFSAAGQHRIVQSFDRYFGMAYALVRTDGGMLSVAPSSATVKNSAGLIDYPDAVTAGAGAGTAEIGPGKEVILSRLLVVADDAARAQQAAAAAVGTAVKTYAVAVTSDTGKPVEGAYVAIRQTAAVAGERLSDAKGPVVCSGFTSAKGIVDLPLSEGQFIAMVATPGRADTFVPVTVDGGDKRSTAVQLGAACSVAFDVVDEAGQSSPVKVQFIGVGSTPNPDLGPDQRADGCRNLWFSVKGQFEVPLPAGDYYVLLSRGPEYDAAWRTLKLTPGRKATVSARLPRVVDTKGWISADFHNHSTLSGDNSTQTEGRLACLIAEHVEFAAATEHQRITSYKPYLKAMGVEALMATSDGMELTGSPLPLMHLNTFPLHAHPHTQFGGGPMIDKDALTQIRRLKDHDNGSDKLMQQNHPDIGWLVFDKDGDGKPDGGNGTLAYTDVIEIWTTTILDQKPFIGFKGNKSNDRMFNWLQLLNQGHRLPGVANTDAHICFHDSGTIRNWVKSETDIPAEIKEMDVVRESRKGRLTMSSGPFLEAWLSGGESTTPAIPGDDIRISGDGKLRIRVQCPNWFGVNRIQVLVNGKPDATLNFTRKTHPAMFADGVVKFDQVLPIKFAADAHVIVVATEEGGTTAPVMGAGGEPPMAISNPIYVDFDGNGFKANGDKLGAPLPVKQ